MSIQQAAADLALLCDRIDAGEDLAEALLTEFADARDNLAAAIDRKKAWLRECGSKLDLIADHKAELELQRKRYQRIAETIHEQTRALIKAHPGLPWRDSTGKKVSLVTARPALIVDFEDKYQGFYDAEALLAAGVDHKFVQSIGMVKIDKAAVREALLAGEELPWAKLQTTEFLRGL